MWLLGAAACAGPAIQQRQAVTVPLFDAALERVSYAELAGEPARLADDVPRAIRRSRWAVLSLENRPPGQQHAPAVYARALLPEDRTAHIYAWRRAGGVAVTVKVGYFGSPAQERAFIEHLTQALAGPPKPRRGGRFTLPPWSATQPAGETTPPQAAPAISP